MREVFDNERAQHTERNDALAAEWGERIHALDVRFLALETSTSEGVSRQAATLERVGDRQEKMVRSYEAIRVDIEQDQKSEQIVALYAKIKGIESAMDSRDEEVRASMQEEKKHRAEQRNSELVGLQENRRQITDLEIKLAERLERESTAREENVREILQEVAKRTGKKGMIAVEDAPRLLVEGYLPPSAPPQGFSNRSSSPYKVSSLQSDGDSSIGRTLSSSRSLTVEKLSQPLMDSIRAQAAPANVFGGTLTYASQAVTLADSLLSSTTILPSPRVPASFTAPPGPRRSALSPVGSITVPLGHGGAPSPRSGPVSSVNFVQSVRPAGGGSYLPVSQLSGTETRLVPQLVQQAIAVRPGTQLKRSLSGPPGSFRRGTVQ